MRFVKVKINGAVFSAFPQWMDEWSPETVDGNWKGENPVICKDKRESQVEWLWQSQD
jgi:hypothetical protein